MNKRHDLILERILAAGNVTVTELSRDLNVSEVTIRNDLNKLAEEGQIVRARGGARLPRERSREELTFIARQKLNAEQKARIGEAAANYIIPFDSILLDASTTAVAVAQAITRRDQLRDITVIATGMWTGIELLKIPDINIFISGGYARRTTGSITGAPARDILKNVNINKAFLGCWGFTLEDGLTDTHLLEIELKKHIISVAKEVIAICDGSKFGKTGLASFAGLEDLTRVITDNSAPKSMIAELRKRDIDVVIA